MTTTRHRFAPKQRAIVIHNASGHDVRKNSVIVIENCISYRTYVARLHNQKNIYENQFYVSDIDLL